MGLGHVLMTLPCAAWGPQGSFWVAHHRHVCSLHVALSARAGGPGAFLQLPLGLAGLPALQTLRVDAPPARNPDIMQVWMKQAFQVG